MNGPRLLSPITLRGLTLRNRRVLSPMCQYWAEDGVANDWHFVHLGKFATGGFGAATVGGLGAGERFGKACAVLAARGLQRPGIRHLHRGAPGLAAYCLAKDLLLHEDRLMERDLDLLAQVFPEAKAYERSARP